MILAALTLSAGASCTDGEPANPHAISPELNTTEERNTMSNESKVAAIRETIEALINAGITSDLSGLQRIYHDSMKIQMIDTDNHLVQHDKASFIAMLQSMIDTNDGTPNDWSEFHIVEATGDDGHVLITRKVNMGGQDRVLVLSIDLLFEDERWQVTREVIFSRPNSETTL